MTISDATYEKWLLADRTRCVLVEAVAYSGGSEVTRYFSNCAYVTGPAEVPANTPYDDILVADSVRFTVELAELFTGRSLPAWGDLEVMNENGERDDWLDDAWDGRALRIYLGDPTWDRADFRLILDGVAADIGSTRRDRLSLKVRDKTWMLNVAAQTTLVGGTTANKDQPKPLAYGQCFNVEPVLDDASLHRYLVHDGQVEDITDVRDNGVTVAYTKDLANGRFTLSAAPAGRITADVKGAKPGGSYLTTCSDIVQDLVTSHSQLTTSDIDATNFAAFETDCPQTLGLYVRSRTNLMELLDALVTSVGGFWTFSRGGLLQLGRLEAPSGSPALSLTADDVKRDQLAIHRRDLPIATLRLGYARNWTPQADGLAGAVSEANRALYAAEHQVSKDENAGLTTTWKLARRPDLIPTLIAGSSDAGTEVARRRALFDTPRTVYRAETFMGPYKVNAGDVVSLDHPRFGFSGGALAVVVGFEERLARRGVTLKLWR